MGIYAAFLFGFILSFMFFMSASEAIPTCTFRSSCSGGETCIFNIFQQNDTHAGSCDSNYGTKVCCTEITSATIRAASCNANEGGVVSIYATSNSHAGRKDHYNNIICAKTADNPVVTNIRADCLSRETCAFSMYQQNDTHVGACGYFGNRLCIQEEFNVTVTMKLNNTEPNWNGGVMLSGVATRSDSSAVDTSGGSSDVTVYQNSTTVLCTTDTNSTGGYTCNFTAPSNLGVYQLNVTVNDTTTSKSWSNTTTFNVIQQFGGETVPVAPQTVAPETSAESIACYEEPKIIQNPDGTIEIAIVTICAWK